MRYLIRLLPWSATEGFSGERERCRWSYGIPRGLPETRITPPAGSSQSQAGDKRWWAADDASHPTTGFVRAHLGTHFPAVPGFMNNSPVNHRPAFGPQYPAASCILNSASGYAAGSKHRSPAIHSLPLRHAADDLRTTATPQGPERRSSPTDDRQHIIPPTRHTRFSCWPAIGAFDSAAR